MSNLTKQNMLNEIHRTAKGPTQVQPISSRRRGVFIVITVIFVLAAGVFWMMRRVTTNSPTTSGRHSIPMLGNTNAFRPITCPKDQYAICNPLKDDVSSEPCECVEMPQKIADLCKERTIIRKCDDVFLYEAEEDLFAMDRGGNRLYDAFWVDNQGRRRYNPPPGCVQGNLCQAIRCQKGGGVLTYIGTTCVDNCGPRKFCGEAFSWGCNCGPEMCWNGESCVSDF